jgi:hypothetical protein
MLIYTGLYHTLISKPVCRLLVLLIFLVFNSPDRISCQETRGNGRFQYIYPPDGAPLVTRESSIIIRYGKKIIKESVTDSLISVTGSSGEVYPGKLQLCKDQKTLIFSHSEPFGIPEKITVKLKMGLYTDDYERIPGTDFSFRVSDNKGIINNDYDNKSGSDAYYSRLKTINNDFPEIFSLISNNPSGGYYFLEENYVGYSYLLIVDNYGTPVFYRILDHNVHNFTLQPAGYLSYFIENQRRFAILDSLYNFTGTFRMKNGYDADSHEFILMKNGHSFMMAYDRQLMRMDTVIEGGNPEATVVGLVIQELDEEQNVIFQWRSWDHFDILDTDESVVDLTSYYVDYVHANSMDIDSDTSLILCSRNLNEITKINRQTGEIIWRLGGKNNQFIFINDDKGFYLQHSAKKLKNGNIILFDNGKLKESEYSRGIEYKLDESIYTVTLVNELRHDSNIYSPIMGHIQRLPNGNTLIGWGKNFGSYLCTEFHPDGSIANDLYSYNNIQSYRVYKFNWKSKAIRLNKEVLLFSTIQPYNKDTNEISITNRSSERLVLNGYSKGNTPFYVLNDFPISIPKDSTRTLQIEFMPNETGEFNDLFTVYSDGLSDNNEIQRIAAQFIIIGVSSATPVENELSDQNNKLKIYPNPVSNYLTLTGTESIASTAVRNINGQLVCIKEIHDRDITVLDCSGIPPGIYFLNLTYNSGVRHTTKFIKK